MGLHEKNVGAFFFRELELTEVMTYLQHKKLPVLLQRGGVITGVTIRIQRPDSENYCTVDPWGRVEWFKGGAHEN